MRSAIALVASAYGTAVRLCDQLLEIGEFCRLRGP
jgi:hypothetical protein